MKSKAPIRFEYSQAHDPADSNRQIRVIYPEKWASNLSKWLREAGWSESGIEFPKPVDHIRETTVMVTDASESNGVGMSEKGITIWNYEEVTSVDRIEVLEYLTAVYQADVVSQDILIGVDSVVAGHWLRKEGSAPKILPPTHVAGKTVRTVYVPTDLNPADVPTREASKEKGFEAWDAAGTSVKGCWPYPMEDSFLFPWITMCRYTLVVHQKGGIRVVWNPLARGIATLYVEERKMRLTQSKKCGRVRETTSDK